MIMQEIERTTVVLISQPEAKSAQSRIAASEASHGTSATHATSTPLHSFLEHSMLILFPFAFFPALYLSTNLLYEQQLIWLVVPALLLGIVIGDFVTGVVHWAADTYCSEDTPIIGQSLIKPFRMHHVDPKEICSHGIVNTLGNTCILGVPLLIVCLIILLSWPTSISASAAFALLTTVIVVGVTVVTNQLHKWAHQDDPPKAVRLLQRTRIILDPKHHEAHHSAPFNSHYSITNGWMNPLLNKVKFFRRLERALRFLKIEPSK
jgi:plasmanylethanolamine desaturase